MDSAFKKQSMLWCIFAVMVFVFLIVLSYFYLKNNDIHFKEQIQLSSGEVVIVDRLFKTESFGELGGPGGCEAKFNSMVIVESNDVNKPPIWQSDTGLIPILFDQDVNTKEWYLVTTFFSCEAWYQLGRPKLPYQEFRLREGKWQAVPLSLNLIGRDANVMTSMRNKDELLVHTLATKHERWRNPKIAPEYKKIVADSTSGC
jgi:hypothetical protein